MIEDKEDDWAAQDVKDRIDGSVMKFYVTLYLKVREERKLIARYI